MSRPMVVRLMARQDVHEIREFLWDRQVSAARKFDSRMAALLRRIESMPFLYAKVWRAVRAVKVRGFKYVVYFVVRTKAVEVIAVVHGSRQSSVWKSRV